MPSTQDMQSKKLTVKDLVFIFSFLLTFGTLVASYATYRASTDARIQALELKSDQNRQELDDHNLDLFDYKLNEIEKKIDKIMVKLGVE